MAVLLETTLGDLVIDLFVKERPRSCLNFVKLCKMKYYNFCQFHSVEQNYVAQTGDPGGKGGESIYGSMYGEQAKFFETEDLPKMRHTRMGLVSFVNNGDNMLGSQFFITLGDNLDYLNDKHTIFGQVTEGLDTLEKLNNEMCDESHKPYRDIRISHAIVIDDPFDDPPMLVYPSRSPSPTFEQLVKPNQIALDEDVNEYEGKTSDEIAEEMAQREMAEQAQILEMVGDLRNADEAPPDNVLFVCKLNPVTTDEDLEIIFRRFGKILGCEIIRDRRTHESLQYAFIEFEDHKSCEQAFFKMDNVLIDDRRIHVDFSQSVSKNYTWKGRDSNVTASDHRHHRDYQQDDRKSERRHVDRAERRPSPRGRNQRDYDTRDRRRETHKRRHSRSRSRNRSHHYESDRTRSSHHKDRRHRSRSR